MSDQQIVTNIVAKSDFSNLIGDLAKVTGSLTALQEKLIATNKTLAAQAAVMNRSFSETLRSTGQFSTHFVSLTSDVDKFGSQLDKGQIKLGQFFNAYRDHMRTSGGIVRDLAKQQVQLQNAVLQPLGRNAEGLMQFNVHVPRGLDEIKNKSAIAQQQLAIMNKLVQEGAGQLINWGKNTQWAGRQLTVGLTVPMVAFGKAASDAFKSADEQLVRLTKVYGGLVATSSEELAKVRKDVTNTARELSKSYGAAFSDTLGLAADIAATGKQGNELLGSIQETTRLSVLGEVDRQEAMKATLSIQTAFKQNTEELSQSINFLNAVENQTSTTLADLVEAIPKAGPVIQGLGGSVKDLALYLTAMREGGINAAEGANALKSGLASLINPTKVATEQFAGFGIDLKGIVTKNAGNLTATLLDLQSALDTLDPLKKQQALEQLFGKFQFARMNALFSNLGKQGSQTLQVLDLMKASSQDLADIAGRELSQVTESASGKYKRAVEGLKADLATIGDKFLEINTRLINFVDGIIKFANRLPGPIKSVLNFLGMITAAAGPLIMLTGVLGNFFGYIIKGVYHFKSFFKGAEGWKLLTPEILAAQKAGSLVEATFYNDAKAAAVLKQSIMGLTSSLAALEAKANSAAIKVQPAITTLAGGVIVPGGVQRSVDPRNPHVGAIDTRASAHLNPTAGKTATERAQETIFSVVPGPIPVNRKIGATPQIMMSGDQPSVPGLSTMHGVSTGIVASEAAKWHSMMGMLAMLSKREVDTVKKEISTTGTMSQEFMGIYSSLFPIISSLTANAADQSQAVIRQAKANQISVEAARAEIIRINAELEMLTAQATTTLAGSMGRTANLTSVPLLGQPIVGPTGKSNMKELFRKNRPEAAVIDRIARILEVRTYGAGYSMETTKPLKRNLGGPVYLSGGSEDPIVPGPNVNRDIVPAILTPGEFVVNKAATAANLPLLQAINAGGSQSMYQDKGTDDALYKLSSKEIRERYYGRQMSHLTEPVYLSSNANAKAAAMRSYGATQEEAHKPTARLNSSLYAAYHAFVNQGTNNGNLSTQQFLDYISGKSIMQTDPRTKALVPVTHDPMLAYEAMLIDLGIPLVDRQSFVKGIDDEIKAKLSAELAAGRTTLSDTVKPGEGKTGFKIIGDIIEDRVMKHGDPEVIRRFRSLRAAGDFRYQRDPVAGKKKSSKRLLKKDDARISTLIAGIVGKKRTPTMPESVAKLFPNIRIKTPKKDPNARVDLRPGKHSGNRLAPLPRHNTGGVVSLNSGGMVPGSTAPIFSAVPAQHFGLGGIVKNILQWLVGKKGPSQILPKGSPKNRPVSPALPVFEDLSAMPLLGDEGALEYYMANGGAKQLGTSVPQAPVSKARTFGAKAIRGAGFIGGWPLAQMAVSKLGIPDPMGMTSMLGMGAINKGAASAASMLTKQSGSSSVLGKFGSALTKEGTALGKFTGAFVKFGTVAARFSGPLTVAVTALQIYGKVQENTRKQQEKASFSLSMNATKAKEAGIVFTDLGKKVAETTNRFKDYKAAAEFNYAQSTQASGTGGLKITVADLAAEEKRVKKQMPKYVESFKDKDINTVISDARALKGQMMALGDKSEAEVDKTIYAIVKAAQGGQAALRVISDDTYAGIDNTQKGLSQITQNVLKIYRDLETYGTDAGVDAINTLWQAMDKNPGLTDTLAEYDALIAKLEKSGYLSEKALGSDFIKQLEVSAPQTAALMKQITNETDSVVSATDKWKIATSGLITDYATIQQLTREEARKLAEFAVEAQGGIDQVMAKMYGPQQKRLAELTAAYNRASKAAKAESVSQQKKTADRLKQIDAEIKKIQDLADARVKAIEDANTAEDYNLQIKKKQLEYQDAIATGNTSAAAQAQLDLQRLVSGRQSDLAVKAIQDRAKKDIAPLSKERDRINNASDEKQWASALAAESAATYKTAMDDLSLKLQTANTGMLNAFYKWAKGENLTAAELKQLKVDYEKLKGKTTMTPEQILQSIQSSFKDFQLTNPQLYSDTIEIFTNGRGAAPSNYGKNFPVRGNADYKEKDGKFYKTADGKTTKITKAQYQSETSEPLRPNTKTQIYSNPEYPHGTALNSANLPIGYAKQFNGLWYFDSGVVTTDSRGKNIVGMWAGKDYKGQTRAYATGGEVKYFGDGKHVTGPGTGTSDSIPAMLSNGEYVIKAAAVEQYGVPFFDAANAQKLATGGKVQKNGNGMPSTNPLGMGMDWFGKTLFNAGNSVIKNLLGFDITKPMSKKSNMEKLSMALLPFGGEGAGVKAAPTIGKGLSDIFLHRSEDLGSIAQDLIFSTHAHRGERVIDGWSQLMHQPNGPSEIFSIGNQGGPRSTRDMMALSLMLGAKEGGVGRAGINLTGSADRSVYAELLASMFNKKGLPGLIGLPAKQEASVGETKLEALTWMFNQLNRYNTSARVRGLDGAIQVPNDALDISRSGLSMLMRGQYERNGFLELLNGFRETMKGQKGFANGGMISKFHKGGAVGHKHLASGHASSQYDSRSNLKKAGHFLSEIVKETGRSFDWFASLMAANDSGKFKSFSQDNQVFANDAIGAYKAGYKSDALKALGVKTGLSGLNVGLTAASAGVGSAAGRTMIEAYGISKGIPSLGTLLPKGSIPYATSGLAKTTQNVAAAAIIGGSRPFTENKVSSLLPDFGPKISLEIGDEFRNKVGTRPDWVEYNGYRVPTYQDKVFGSGRNVVIERPGDNFGPLAESGLVDDVIPTSPQGILEYLVKRNPKNKELQSMLDNFASGRIGALGPKEKSFLTKMYASKSFDTKGNLLDNQDHLGIKSLIGYYTGDKTSILQLKAKTKALSPALRKLVNSYVKEYKKDVEPSPYDLLASQTPVLRSFNFGMPLDAQGNISEQAAGLSIAQNLWANNGNKAKYAYSRLTKHLTIGDEVQRTSFHTGNSSWADTNPLMVTTLESAIKHNNNPEQLHAIDSIWMQAFGKPFFIPKEEASLIWPIKGRQAYNEKLIERGLLEKGQVPKLITEDPATKEIFYLSKPKYSDKELQWLIDEFQSNPRLPNVRRLVNTELDKHSKGTVKGNRHEPFQFANQQHAPVKYTPSRLLRMASIDRAKMQLGIDESYTEIMSNTTEYPGLQRLAEQLGVRYSGSHTGSGMAYAESTGTNSPSSQPSNILDTLLTHDSGVGSHQGALGQIMMNEYFGKTWSGKLPINHVSAEERTSNAIKEYAWKLGQWKIGKAPQPTWKELSEKLDKIKKDQDSWGHEEEDAQGGYISPANHIKRLAKQGINIPKFDNGINMVPQDMIAMIHKNEAVVPANMNPYNPNANTNGIGTNTVYTIAPVINAAPGMDENAITDIATRKVLQAMQNLDKLNASKLGVTRVINPRGEMMH